MPTTLVKAGAFPFDIFFYDLAQEMEFVKENDSHSWLTKFFLSGCFCLHFANQASQNEFKAVYMDQAFCTKLTEDEKYALLQHEAGHIVNRDCFSGKIVNGIVASKQLEKDADTYALKAGAKPMALAKAIFKSATHGMGNLPAFNQAVCLFYVVPELTVRYASIAKFWLKARHNRHVATVG